MTPPFLYTGERETGKIARKFIVQKSKQKMLLVLSGYAPSCHLAKLNLNTYDLLPAIAWGQLRNIRKNK